MKTLHSEIEASPARVWNILTDTAAYANWTPFIPRLSGTLQRGEKPEVRIERPAD